jgi:hypothetical protein
LGAVDHAARRINLSADSREFRDARKLQASPPKSGEHAAISPNACREPSAPLSCERRERYFLVFLGFPTRLASALGRRRFDAVNPGAALEKESAGKPGSVVGSHSSGMRVAAQL